MKFQVTLHKDDWKWVFTQLAKFTFKHSPHYRLDCVAIRSLPSEAEVEFNSCDGTTLASAVVFSDRSAFDRGDGGVNYALFLPKAFKDALAVNPKKGKEDVTLRIETSGEADGSEKKCRAYLDDAEIPTEDGRYPDVATIQSGTMKDARMPFEVDAKAIKAGLKDYFDKAKSHRVTMAKFKSDGAICLTGDSQSKTAFMYVRRRTDCDKKILRKEYGERIIGRVFDHLPAEWKFYEEKHCLNAGRLYKVAEFMADAHSLGVDRSKFGIHRFYADCEKRARFHISTIVMPMHFDKPELGETDEIGKPVVYEVPKPVETPDPVKPVAKPKPLDDAVLKSVQDFVADYILRHALNKRIGSDHFTARVLGLVQTLDAVEDEYFQKLADVRAQIGGPQFEMIKNGLDQILNNQPDAFQATILKAIQQAV